MLEFLAVASLITIGLGVLGVLLVVGFFFKLVVRLLLLPFALLGGLLKVLAFIVIGLLGLIVAPVLLGALVIVALIALPILFFLGLFGIGWAAAAA